MAAKIVISLHDSQSRVPPICQREGLFYYVSVEAGGGEGGGGRRKKRGENEYEAKTFFPMFFPLFIIFSSFSSLSLFLLL